MCLLTAEIAIGLDEGRSCSEKLLELKPFVHCTFSRKPRSLMDVDRWKATEFRQFLLYRGKIALKRGLICMNTF